MKESIETILKKLEGLNTISSIVKTLGIKRSTAIKKIHILKKMGYVETSGGGKQPRFYKISRIKIQKIGNPGLYEVVNENSPIKLHKPYEHRVIGKKIEVEEAIVRAIKSKEFRLILASLALFNKIKSWSRLYNYAKEENVRRKVGALYDVAKRVIRVRKMDKKTRKLLLSARNEKKHIIKNFKSKSFQDIEKEWNVFIPFNRQDLDRYEE
ncbi:hypothetical protein HYT57_02660 [Candidatus Woesearchaeota archaeon]|nr:hypothetical protein [Candidatus Woesearchaeota archaeon]